ncbi:hypothetical protein GGF46_005246 [Coemansia sp. RSA 552]|nr:hypothetical protein GGF46_005246 [Coemansia sp. RSA 552]
MDLGFYAEPPETKPAGSKPIGMACRACRLRKIRCGGERPRCSYCVKKGYECLLTPHKKRGRPRKNEQREKPAKPSPPPMLGAASGGGSMTMPADLDVNQLWSELTGTQVLPPELQAMALDSATQAQDANPGVAPTGVFDLAGVLQTPADEMLFANYAFPTGDPPQQPHSQLQAMALDPAARTPVAGSSTSSHSAAGDDPQVSSLVGSDRSGVSISTTVDAGIRAYFTYVQPWMPILHRPTFEREVSEGRVDVLLYYAVQAVAARFKPAADKTRRKPWRRGQRFAKAARKLVPGALRTATLSTLQAVTLLALYLSVSGQWQEGAAYERLAVQLAFIGQYHLLDEEFLLPPVANNMGIYETGWSEHSQPARLEVLSRPGGILDHEQRRRAWWCVFQLERFNGLAMGRPPIIKPGWHWVWLPCSEELWAKENPSGPLAWEMGLATSGARPEHSVSNCRVDLVLALIMGQLVEQRTEMFRLFFPRVDRGTLFYDNLPTHSLGWPQRLRRLCDAVGSLERRVRQWHAELDRYADSFSTRRHANFEVMGASCQIHIYACVLQIREHLFEDLLAGSGDEGSSRMDSVDSSSVEDNASLSSADLSAAVLEQTGVSFDRAAYQRGYTSRARRPDLSTEFVRDLDTLAQRCWRRSIAMSDEVARLLRVHWLRPIDEANDPVSVFDEPLVDTESQQSRPSSMLAAASDSRVVADRFKLMSPQTPYHLFIAGKVQAARLKQAVTAQSRSVKKEASSFTVGSDVAEEVVRGIADIWDSHEKDTDKVAIEARLDDIIVALEYCQLFWFSLNFAAHLKYLKREAQKPLLTNVYR